MVTHVTVYVADVLVDLYLLLNQGTHGNFFFKKRRRLSEHWNSNNVKKPTLKMIMCAQLIYIPGSNARVCCECASRLPFPYGLLLIRSAKNRLQQMYFPRVFDELFLKSVKWRKTRSKTSLMIIVRSILSM